MHRNGARFSQRGLPEVTRIMLRPFLIIFAAYIANVTADPIDPVLERYIGMPVEQIVSDLGEPMLRTPLELWYRHESAVNNGNPGAPNPTVSLGGTGVIIYGPGVDDPSLTMSRDLCDVTVRLNRKEIITSIDHRGPGCFEFIHRLKQSNTAPP